MTLLNNLKKVRAAIADDSVTNDPSPISSALNIAAMAAMFEGMPKGDNTKTKWADYMAIFCENSAQLTRLTVEDPNEDEYLKQMRAYIVADGICDPGTNFNIPMHVDPRIDGINGSITNPPVSPAPNDPGGAIKGRRPLELRNII